MNISSLLSPLQPLPEPAADFTFMVKDTEAALSPYEAALASHLARRLFDERADMLMSGLYFEGMEPITNLGIAVPPELHGLRAVLGWPEIGVGALNERLEVQGFRLPSSTSIVADLGDIWAANNLAEESPLAHLDAMVYGRCPIVIGTREGGGQPVITIESPLDMIVHWDPRRRAATAALQTYIETDPTSEHYFRQRAVLYIIGATIHMVRGEKGWQVTDRDDHGLPMLPVVQLVNRPRVRQRNGRSEITLAWRNTVDRAARNMVAMEVSREINAAPPRYIIAAAESAFQNADGEQRTAWQTYIGRFLALEADEHGNLPQVGTFDAVSPEPFTKLHDLDVRQMSALTGVPPQFLGILSDGNPASADAIRISDFRLKTRADEKTTSFGGRWEEVQRIALFIRDGELPPDADRMETDWAPTGIPTPAADTDAVVKQIQAKMIPPESEVALERVGYSALERERISADRRAARGRRELADLIGALAPEPELPPEQSAA
ncbi:phage portal protein [Nocardia amikacinitolerans]|uniref:phage portal protein n=1 Tax=Nocardia amikacinitolerans TaxID=756689 RepID=UPI000BE42044|nr:phage portal protein [Nocardia amikacinitolerans]